MTGRSIRVLAGMIMGLLGQVGMAVAGPSDTVLPTFGGGVAGPALAVYYAFGVIKNNGLETDFVCTNISAGAQNIGFQVFDETGALRNTWLPAGSNGEVLSVAVGQTVTVGTSGTNALHEDQTLTLNAAGSGVNTLRNGSGRIVSTSKNIACTASLVDKFHIVVDPSGLVPSPGHATTEAPPTMSNLPLTKLP